MLVQDSMASKPSENLVKTKMLHETSTKSSQNLRKIHEMPRHLRFNKYVLTHYRPPSDSIGCLKSLFYLHNETVNILTHGIPVVVILASIPWLLPWDELKVPYLPSFHVVASIAPWIGSTIYHLFMNHNTVFTGEMAYRVLLIVDLLGIWVTQTTGGLITICATIACMSESFQTKFLWTYGLLCLYCLYKTLTAKCLWGRRFSFTAPFLVRMSMVIIRCLGVGGGHPMSFSHIVKQDAIAVTGAIIGGINIPERWFPGRLDLICNSHHLMHLLVVYAVYEMHLGVNWDLKWMTAINEGTAQCNQNQMWWSNLVDSYLA